MPCARSFSKKARRRAAHSSASTPDVTSKRVIEPRVATDREERVQRARLRVVASVDDAVDAREDEGARAHRARLERHVRRRADESAVVDRHRRATHREHLGVRRGILVGLAEVVRAREDRDRPSRRRSRRGPRPSALAACASTSASRIHSLVRGPAASHFSAPRKIRTSDPWFRRPMLYPAELWARVLGHTDGARGRKLTQPGSRVNGTTLGPQSFQGSGSSMTRRSHPRERWLALIKGQNEGKISQ